MKKYNMEKNEAKKNQKNKVRRLFLYLNILLIIIILVLIFNRFHKKEIKFSCDYNSHPVELVKEINYYNQKAFDKDLTLLFFFKKVPFLSNIEDLDKLYLKYKDKISIFVLFEEKFKMSHNVEFPFRMAEKVCFTCAKKFDDKYYLLLKGKKVIYADNYLNLFDINLIIQKSLHPGKTFSDYQVSIERLRKNVLRKFGEKRDLAFVELRSNKLTRWGDIQNYSRIYLFHMNCSACNIKRMISEVKLKKVLDEQKIIMVFSVLTNSAEIKSLVDLSGFDIPIYLDYKDELGLISVISDEKKFPVIIDVEEIEGQDA